MNNINIKNIFPNTGITDTNNNSTINIHDFSINTLTNSNTFKSSISDDFIVNKIKLNKKNEIAKRDELYETKYKECLLKINDSVELNLTDIIFSVELSYFGYKSYNSFECLNYIQKKLIKNNFLTLIISSKEIFISWKNIIES